MTASEPGTGWPQLKRQWDGLSSANRRLLMAGAAVDGGLKIAALADLRRREADAVRGPRWLWAIVVTLVNSVGLVPLAYFAFGRRR